MSYRIEDKDIVISGFENGIADNPYQGISDMRNIENASIPGEASVAFKTTNSVTQTKLTSQSFTASSSSGLLLTWAGGTALADNTAITVANSGGGLPGNLAVNTTYYVRDSTSTTFKVALTAGGTAITYSSAGTGTNSFSTINMDKPKFFAPLITSSTSGIVYLYFMIDASGRVWYYYNSTQWVYLNNLSSEDQGGGTTGNNGNGMVVYKGYLIYYTKTNANVIQVALDGVVFTLANITDKTNNFRFNNWAYLNAFLQTTEDKYINASIFKSGGIVSSSKLAQSISLPFTSPFSSIIIPMKSTQTFSSLMTITICADSTGTPGSVLYTSSNSINANTLTSTVADQTFTFSSPVNLATNTTYWIVLNAATAPGSNGDNIQWMGSPYSIYAYGVPKYLSDVPAWTSTSSTFGLNTLQLSLITAYPYPATISHQSIVGLDGGGSVYFCNGNAVGSILETSVYNFDPFDNRSYTFNTQALNILADDVANCLAEVGTTLLVGGSRNFLYPWDRVSPSYSYPIWLAENNIQAMVTVNTNTYIFAGQRGKIYLTNGSQAQLYKKIPDHLSGVPTPYYTWGGASFTRNQLYFGLQATNNAGTAINQYGGMWSIDLNTNALRLINELSYGSYVGVASAVQAVLGSPTGDGYGLLTGWYDGTNGGVDKGSSNPYSGGEAYIDTDMIPVGTYLNPFTPAQVEWKTSTPLVANENIQLYYRLNISDAFTLIPSTTLSLVGQLSDVVQTNFQKAQWVQLRAVLTSTNTTPSFNRLTEIRIRNYPN